jgi:4-hydroxy-tetrahydrodipicolinate synthase
MRALYDAATSGGLDRAREIHESLAPIYDATVVTSNPIPVKTALQMLGVVEDNMRLPMVPASEDERAAVRAALEKHGLLVAGGAG